jgi:hypothetical protein
VKRGQGRTGDDGLAAVVDGGGGNRRTDHQEKE